MQSLRNPRTASPVSGTQNCCRQTATVCMSAMIGLLVWSPGNALALHWQAAPNGQWSGLCLVDPGRCGEESVSWVEAAVEESAALATSADDQQIDEIGEEVPVAIDSGMHVGSSAEAVRVFEQIVQVDAAPWIRLHFREVVLARGDRIEVRALDDRMEVLKRRHFRDGRGASRYMPGSGVSVALFAGPEAKASRLVVSGVEYGYASRPRAMPRSICEENDPPDDDRWASDDDRVCALRFTQRVCSVSRSIPCGCPGTGYDTAVEQCRDGQCYGGSRNTLDCGNGACPDGETCEDRLRSFSGTAFFITSGTAPGRCLLTAGHNFFRTGEELHQNSNFSTMLLCGAYGCGDFACEPDPENPGRWACPDKGPRPKEPCVTAVPAEPERDQYKRLHLVDGELGEQLPADWALVRMRPSRDHGAFRLGDQSGDQPEEIPDAVVTGHGTDDDPITMNYLQQTAFGRAIRSDKDTDPEVNDSNVIAHFIDTEHGNSGSPLIRDGDVVFGIHVQGRGVDAAGNPILCADPDEPNYAVSLNQQNRIDGRPLDFAMLERRCRGTAGTRSRFVKRIRSGTREVGSRVEYEIKMTGSAFAATAFTVRDFLPPELEFVSVRSTPPEALQTPDALPDADGVLHVDIAASPVRSTLLVYVAAYVRDNVEVGTIVDNYADAVDAGEVLLGADREIFQVRPPRTVVDADPNALALNWSTAPPPKIRPSEATYYKFAVSLRGLIGAGTLVMDFCEADYESTAWSVQEAVMLGAGLLPDQEAGLERSFTNGCKHIIGNVPPGVSPSLLVIFKATLKPGTPAYSRHVVLARLTDAGRTGTAAITELSTTVTAMEQF